MELRVTPVLLRGVADPDPGRLLREGREHPDDGAARHVAAHRDRRSVPLRASVLHLPVALVEAADAHRLAGRPVGEGRRELDRPGADVRAARPAAVAPARAARARPRRTRPSPAAASSSPGGSSRFARWSERARRSDGRTPRYYAEKHGNTWLVDRRELPPSKLIVLLRDPRDTYASIEAFEDKEPRPASGCATRGGTRTGSRRIIERQRQRLQWIARLLDAGRVPVVRYEELTGDLPRWCSRLEEHLQVEARSGRPARR